MTLFEQTARRASWVTSALVASIAAAAIIVSGLMLVLSLTAPPSPTISTPDRGDRAVAAGRAWERQRRVESAAYYERLHAAEVAGLAWQLRSELTNPNR